MPMQRHYPRNASQEEEMPPASPAQFALIMPKVGRSEHGLLELLWQRVGQEQTFFPPAANSGQTGSFHLLRLWGRHSLPPAPEHPLLLGSPTTKTQPTGQCLSALPHPCIFAQCYPSPGDQQSFSFPQISFSHMMLCQGK